MAEHKRYDFSFDLDGITAILKDGVELLLAVFRPVSRFISSVAGSGWAGFAIIFALFFMIFLLRMGARSGRIEVYSDGLEYIGLRGLIVSAIYLGLLTAEFLLMPPLVMIVMLFMNTAFGHGEPGIVGFFGLLLHGGAARDALFSDLLTFYGRHELLLPLGFRSAGLITVAFGAMYVVSQGIGRHRGREATE